MARHRLALALAAAWLPFAAGAVERAVADDPLATFATCAGRFSALMEHQWMMDGPGSEETARRRLMMIDLIDAIILPEQGIEVLSRRIEAKHAQASLLTRATFSADTRESATAGRLAQLQLSQCELLLPS